MSRLKKILYSIFTSTLLAVIALPLVSVQGADSPWINVGPGIDYQEFEMDGPTDAYVARMDRSNENDTLESVVANGALVTGGEIVSSMAERIDQSISAWSPGTGFRNRVVVAINGSGYTGYAEPKSGMIVEGFYAKRFDDLGGGSGFGWRTDRTPFIGRCVNNDPNDQYVNFPDAVDDEQVQINGINIARGENQLILYTPQYGSNTGTSDGELEVVVEFRDGFLLQSNPGVIGVVTNIQIGTGSTTIPFDAIVLSASGTAKETLLKHLNLNGRIEVSQRISHTDWDCVTEDTFSWAHTYASMHGDYAVLRDGEVYPKSEDLGATRSQPRTAIAYNDDYVFFIVVDGRSAQSIGMTFEQLGEFARDQLGATWAIAQDGGGSSVMVINGQVVNNPVSKCVVGGDAYIPDITDPSDPPDLELGLDGSYSVPTESGDVYACERAVANSMMMVYLESPVFSTEDFDSFDLVQTNTDTDVRLGPGTNYDVVQTVPAETSGMILPHLGGLNGVMAKGSYWWRVNLDGVIGWVQEDDLIYISTPPGNLGARIDVALLDDN